MIKAGDKPVKEYDAFVHNQEWNIEKDGETVSTVQIRNLLDIVKERLDKYLQNSVVEVPVGSVIWQYINLDKWYAANDDGNDINYAGFRPTEAETGIESIDDSKYPFYSSRIQGVSKEINRLLDSVKNRTIDSEGNSIVTDVKEILPICKRDYVLCDGAYYKVPTCLYKLDIENNILEVNKYADYNRFKDLFYTIGYNYTDDRDVRNHYQYEKSGDVYKFKNESKTSGEYEFTLDNRLFTEIKNDSNNPPVYKEILYGRDLCQLYAFYYLYAAQLKNMFIKSGTDTRFDRNKALEWLKGIEFKKEEYFTSPVINDPNNKDYNEQLYYIESSINEYEGEIPEEGIDPSRRTFRINLGTEVNSFNSDITLMYHRSEVVKTVDGETVKEIVTDYERCKVWQLPEVQLVLDLFEDCYGADKDKENPIKLTNKLEKYCTYYYNVPNFNAFKDKKYKTGSFIGSSGVHSFSDIHECVANDSVCYFTENQLPHRHTLFIGWNSYGNKNPECGQIPPKLSTVSSDSNIRCSAYNVSRTSGDYPGRGCSEPVNNYVVQFNPNVELSLNWMNDLGNLDKSLTRENMYYSKKMMYTYIDEEGTTRQYLYEPDRGITSRRSIQCKQKYFKNRFSRRS